jgi:hypothetical protein
MIDYHLSLPQLEHRPFLTDSGLETKLIFIDGVELPEFAAFVLLETAADSSRRRRPGARIRTGGEGSAMTAIASTSSTRRQSRCSSI